MTGLHWMVLAQGLSCGGSQMVAGAGSLEAFPICLPGAWAERTQCWWPRQRGLQVHLCHHGLHRGLQRNQTYLVAAGYYGDRPKRNSRGLPGLGSHSHRSLTQVTSAAFCPAEQSQRPHQGHGKGTQTSPFVETSGNESADTSLHPCFTLLSPGFLRSYLIGDEEIGMR